MKRVAVVIVGVALVVLGLFSLQFLGAPPPTTAPSGTAGVADPMQADLSAADELDSTGDPDRARLDPGALGETIPGDLTVELVFERTGSPARGVGVTVLPRNGRSTLLELRQQVTDDTGRAVFDALDPGSVDVAVGRLASAHANIEPGAHQTVRLAVPTGIRLEGEVVGPAGQPVAGAQVLYWDRIPTLALTELPVPVAVTDALGGFTIDPYLRLGPVSATAQGYLPSPRYSPAIADGESTERFSQVAPSQTPRDITISLRIELGSEPGSVNGIVVDQEGAPVVNALVRTTPPRSRAAVDEAGNFAENNQPLVRVTGDDGRFQLQVAEDTAVAVWAAGYAPYQKRLEVAPGQQLELQVVLVESPGVSGVVRSTTGQPLAGASVGASMELGLSTRAITRGDGSYHLDAVLVGSPLQMFANDPDHLIQRATLQVGSGERTGWDPVLEPLARLRGRVVDEVGRSLSGWALQVSPPTQPMRTPYVPVSAETAEDGGFDLGVLPDKPYVPRLREPGQWIPADLSELGELYGGRPELLIVVDSDMMATSFVRGVLRDDTGQPLDGVSLQLYDGRFTARLDIRTDESGGFEIGPIVARHYRLEARGSERNLPRIDLIEFDLEPRQELDLGELTVASQGTLVYSVRGPDGEQVPGQLNGFLHSDLSALETPLFFDAQGDGKATVPSGDYTVQVMASGYMRVARKISVAAGQEQTISLQLYAGDTVTLSPVLPDNPGLTDGEHIEARTLHADGDWSEYIHGVVAEGKLYDEVSHSSGTPRPWRLHSVLSPGAYTLELTAESGKVFSGTFTVLEHRDPDQPLTVHCLAR